MPTIVLLSSPLLPSSAYEPLVGALEASGHRARVLDVGVVQTAAGLVDTWAGQVEPGDVLLAHSNAGYLAPAVREAVGGMRTTLLLDAALPPAPGPTRPAPAPLRPHLSALVDSASGLLPPWTRWWPRNDLLEVAPEEWLDRLDADCPRLPGLYLDTPVEVPEAWAEGPWGYLGLSEAYASEVAQARELDWPVEVIEGATHLEWLYGPQRAGAVAQRLTALLGRV